MKFYGPEDFENGNFEKSWRKIEEISRRAQARILKEGKAPEFNTIEEALEYYHAIPFEEYLKQIYEKYGK